MTWDMAVKKVLILTLLMSFPYSVGNALQSSVFPLEDSNPIECLRKAARAYGLPFSLLMAVKRVESGSEWHLPPTVNSNGSLDYGPLQVNDWWLSSELGQQLQLQRNDLEDVCFSLELGTYILWLEISSYGYEDGIASYHTGAGQRKSQRGKGYYKKVITNEKEIIANEDF